MTRVRFPAGESGASEVNAMHVQGMPMRLSGLSYCDKHTSLVCVPTPVPQVVCMPCHVCVIRHDISAVVETMKILWDVIVWLRFEIDDPVPPCAVGVRTPNSEKWWALAVASGVDRHRQEMAK